MAKFHTGQRKEFTAKEVFGGSSSAEFIGVFGASSRDQVNMKPKELQEEEAQIAKARQFGKLQWTSEELLPPDFAVVVDDRGPSYRAELSVFVGSGSFKEARMLGPLRTSAEEARKDGNDLRRIAFTTAGQDPLPMLTALQRRCRELEGMLWPVPALIGEDIQPTSEQQLPALRAKQQTEEHGSITDYFCRERKREVANIEFTPVGASALWAQCQVRTPVPSLPGVWYMHESKDQEGKHFPVLFFNSSTGKYYRNRTVTDGVYNFEQSKWIQTGVPNLPQELPIRLSQGSACLPGSSGRKDAIAVMLPELANTSAQLKMPLHFLDKPAALFLLVDGLRNSTAAEWCAKRFHTQLIPRLSACHSSPEDFELVQMVKESLEHLDHALQESGARYAGCSIAVALALGSRLLVSTVGACAAMICSPVEQPAAKATAGAKRPATVDKASPTKWSVRALEGNIPGHTLLEVQKADRKRRLEAYAPLDFDAKPGELLSASSVSEESLDSQSLSDADRLEKKALRAAHPFAALGMTHAEAVAAAPGAGMQAVTSFQNAVGSPVGKPLLAAALHRVKCAGEAVDKMLGTSQFGAQQLATLCYAMDEEDGIISPQRAAALLGVEPACGEAAAQAAVEIRYRAVLGSLDAVCPADAVRGWSILREVIDAASRPAAPPLWLPPAGSRGVEATRAMGLRDLKRPRKLIGLEIVTNLLHLESGSNYFLTLLTKGARTLTQEEIADALSEFKGRPKAASIQMASTAVSKLQGLTESSSSEKKEVPSLGVLSACFSVAAAVDEGNTASDPKKRKLGEKDSAQGFERPARVRVAHLLVKYESSTTSPDPQARRPAPKGRTQADAEKLLLTVLKTLDAIPQGTPESNKKTSTKFGELCRQHSDCKSATSGTFSDLGWITPGKTAREIDSIAFDMPVGGVSDIFMSPRGLHILHRLG